MAVDLLSASLTEAATCSRSLSCNPVSERSLAAMMIDYAKQMMPIRSKSAVYLSIGECIMLGGG